MKRILISLLVTVLAFPSEALAQWWLFPGSKSRKDTASVKVKALPSDSLLTSPPEAQAADSVIFRELPAEDEPSVIKAALLLPFKSEETPNGNFLDFYCGVLMAVEELSEIGCRIDLTVEDCTGEDFTDRCRLLKDTPVIIGPVNMQDINRCISILPDRWIISPLEPKAEDFAQWCHVVQTPTPYRRQIEELVSWIRSDARKGDRIVLLQDDSPGSISTDQTLVLELNEKGISYETSGSPGEYAPQLGSTTRFILVPDDGNYAADKVREIALMKLGGEDVVLYSTSKIRNMSSIENGNLHICQAHVTLNYHADRYSDDVVRFTKNYKERFLFAPGMFAFHGYDIAKYFISMYERYGSGWTEGMARAKWTGLQSDFSFSESVNMYGKLNSAVRRIIYNRDDTITLVK